MPLKTDREGDKSWERRKEEWGAGLPPNKEGGAAATQTTLDLFVLLTREKKTNNNTKITWKKTNLHCFRKKKDELVERILMSTYEME